VTTNGWTTPDRVSRSELLATHPTTAQRIAALAALEVAQQRRIGHAR
jgi:Zn-dependent protease with chaperone function